jgi:hypothetical protein
MLRKPPTRIEMKLEEGLLKEHQQMLERKYKIRKAAPHPFQANTDRRTVNERIGIQSQQRQ